MEKLFQKPNLKPEDWESIGRGYWLNSKFRRAAIAYSKAPQTARNLYRQARGMQISQEREKATVIYNQLVQGFPHTSEAGDALLQLTELTDNTQEAKPYLNQTKPHLNPINLLDTFRYFKPFVDTNDILLSTKLNINNMKSFM